MTKDRVTPEAADHHGDQVKGMLRNYGGDPANVTRAFNQPNIKELFYGFIDQHGWDSTNLLERFRHEVYGKFLGYECPDLTQLQIPSPKHGFDWILPIVAIHDTMPNEAIFQIMKGHFAAKENSAGAWKWTDRILDEVVVHNDRDPLNGPYVIRSRDRVEADEEWKNFSANQLAERKITGITLYERFVMGAFYYVETGQYLDVQNVTLCRGSRSDDGDVPDVDWDPDDRKLRVYWCYPDYRYGYLRSREVVSY